MKTRTRFMLLAASLALVFALDRLVGRRPRRPGATAGKAGTMQSALPAKHPK